MSYESDWVSKTWTVKTKVGTVSGIAIDDRLRFVGNGSDKNGDRVINMGAEGAGTVETAWGEDFVYDAGDKVTDVKHDGVQYKIERTEGSPNVLTCRRQFTKNAGSPSTSQPDESTTSACWTATDGGG
jgi:hypothetical protein